MPEIDLSILLKLIDNASAEFKKVNADAIKEVEKLKNANISATNEATAETKKANADAIQGADKLKQANVSANKESKNAVDQLNKSTQFYRLQTDALGQSIGLVKGELGLFNKAIANGVQLTDEQKERYAALQAKLKEFSKKEQKDTKDGFESINSEMRNFRRNAFAITAAIGLATLSIAEYAKFNEEARLGLDRVSLSLNRLKVIAGSGLAESSNFIAGFVGLAEKISPLANLIKLASASKGDKSLFDALGRQEDLSKAVSMLEIAQAKLKEIDLLFQSGTITAENYYQKINEGEFNAISLRTQAIASLSSCQF